MLGFNSIHVSKSGPSLRTMHGTGDAFWSEYHLKWLLSRFKLFWSDYRVDWKHFKKTGFIWQYFSDFPYFEMTPSTAGNKKHVHMRLTEDRHCIKFLHVFLGYCDYEFICPCIFDNGLNPRYNTNGAIRNILQSLLKCNEIYWNDSMWFKDAKIHVKYPLGSIWKLSQSWKRLERNPKLFF